MLLLNFVFQFIHHLYHMKLIKTSKTTQNHLGPKVPRQWQTFLNLYFKGSPGFTQVFQRVTFTMSS